MQTHKTTARVIGVMFIVASAAAIAGGTLLLPSVDPGYLTEAAAAESRVVTGALLEVIQAMAVIGVAVLFFPILRQRHEGMALGFVGARTFEGVLTVGGAIAALSILGLSREYGQAVVSGVEPLGETLIVIREWTYWLGPMLMFSLSALILYTMLYRAKLVPNWLSIWGLAGGVLLLVRTFLEMYGQEFSAGVQFLFASPIGINEMVLAVWLIIKGFNATPELASETEKELVHA